MSIQRYDTFGDTDDDGGYVTYADHVAAVAEAEQRVGKTAHVLIVEGYRQGYAAALAEAREAVTANRLNGLVTEGWEHTINETIDEALAAIDALKPEVER